MSRSSHCCVSARAILSRGTFSSLLRSVDILDDTIISTNLRKEVGLSKLEEARARSRHAIVGYHSRIQERLATRYRPEKIIAVIRQPEGSFDAHGCGRFNISSTDQNAFDPGLTPRASLADSSVTGIFQYVADASNRSYASQHLMRWGFKITGCCRDLGYSMPRKNSITWHQSGIVTSIMLSLALNVYHR